MPWNLVGPAFKLQHGVLIQKLCEQQHTILGGRKEKGPAWFLTYIPERPGSTTSPTSSPRIPGPLFSEEHSFSSVLLLRDLSPTAPPLSSLHPVKHQLHIPNQQEGVAEEYSGAQLGVPVPAVSEPWAWGSPLCRSARNLK